MDRRLFIFFSIVFTFFLLEIKAQITVSGIVQDANTREVLIGVHIYESTKKVACVTDNNGYYSIHLNDTCQIHYSYVGYKLFILDINSKKDVIVNALLESANELEEVVVSANKPIRNNVINISTKELQSLPSISSKPDVLKTLQLMPGIQSQNEGSSLLLVRGGDPGQNLFLIDGIPLLYVNHIGGYMSVFNPEMISNTEVYKASFPPKYGGKLSSIVDITQREGDAEKFRSTVSVGLTDISCSFEGPVNNKSNFVLTGRKTFYETYMMAVTGISDGNDAMGGFGFHDINAKYTLRADSKNSFHINLYEGDDYFFYKKKKEYEISESKSRTSTIWGNWMISGIWKTMVTEKLFTSTSLSYSRYRLKNKQLFGSGVDSLFSLKNVLKSELKEILLQSDWKYSIANNYKVNFGVQSSLLFYNPSSQIFNEEHLFNSYSITTSNTSLYLNNKIQFLHNSSINLGGRAIGYYTRGFTDYNFEPRISLNLGFVKNQWINFSYMSTKQFSHLLFTQGSISNNEIWIPADEYAKPANVMQWSAGWRATLLENKVSLQCDLYRKEMSSLTTYKEQYNTILGDVYWRNKLETEGSGHSQGLEILSKLNLETLNCFASYTYSRSIRQYNNINNGVEYIFDFDRPHTASVGFRYKLNHNFRLNFVWVYQTGLPYTPAIGRRYANILGISALEPEYFEALIYGVRNSERIKDYHRLDMSVNYDVITKRGNNAQWTFSVYNLYNRKNPYLYYLNTTNTMEMLPPDYEIDTKYHPVKLYQLTAFPLIPTFSYKVFFERNSLRKPEGKVRGEKVRRWLYHKY
ncbi:MAG: carboxypeptidase-like regulatory domain-containing protein [Bacteroidales bacterium]|nr:carboxypeptidase-like regulatory domain-containing protein [Bacteroidales bacterium]MBN2819198.1 carboxypeptidase-like regulatory domain-containing protein [Bacteroidales bacterium]